MSIRNLVLFLIVSVSQTREDRSLTCAAPQLSGPVSCVFDSDLLRKLIMSGCSPDAD